MGLQSQLASNSLLEEILFQNACRLEQKKFKNLITLWGANEVATRCNQIEMTFKKMIENEKRIEDKYELTNTHTVDQSPSCEDRFIKIVCTCRDSESSHV